jgi:hypothetical protein
MLQKIEEMKRGLEFENEKLRKEHEEKMSIMNDMLLSTTY